MQGVTGKHPCCACTQGPQVEPQTLLDVSGAVPESVTDNLLAACRSNVFTDVQAAITAAIADGWGVRAAHNMHPAASAHNAPLPTSHPCVHVLLATSHVSTMQAPGSSFPVVCKSRTSLLPLRG